MFIIGDTHGLTTLLSVLQDFFTKSELTSQSFIHVGDVGLGFKTIEEDVAQLQLIDKLLEEYDSKLYMIRGNHDNPHWWNYWHVYKDRTPNIDLVADYCMRPIEGEMVLFIGGAISIDRNLRSLGRDYWIDEGVAMIPLSLIPFDQMYDVTMVITHCAPYNTYPLIDNPIKQFGERLGKELIAERQYLSDIRERLPKTVKRWYYGHYHTSSINYDRHIRYECVDQNTIVECRM